MAINTPGNRDKLSKDFIQLQTEGALEITSPETPVYNCIAWAMGIDSWWIDFNTRLVGHWWPEGVETTGDPSTLIEAFEAVGFEKCDTSDYEEGYDKVILYHNLHTRDRDGNDVGDKWSHAARILSDGYLHSKFGESFDAKHIAGKDVFIGSLYGDELQYMRRKISDRERIINMLPREENPIKIQEEKRQQLVALLKKQFGLKLN